MTTEEKAKAYDEALSKCKAYIDDTEKRWSEEFSRATEEVFKEIFPELRESEDERVIKALETFINQPEIADKITFEARIEWLAWLEQKKTPSASFEPAAGFDSGSAIVYHNDESEDERIRKEIVECIETLIKQPGASPRLCDWLAWLEKQKEQKPDVNACKARARFIHNVLSGNDMKKMVELYNDEIPEGKNAVWAVIYTHKPKEQKPVEWSEEDENMVWNIISIVGQSKSLQQDAMIDWLKSLRPSWKPSEEQMKALNAMNCYGELSYQGQQQLLIDLYQQLKKL